MRHDVTLQDGTLTLRPLTPEDLPALCALADADLDEYRQMGTLPNTPASYEAALDSPTEMPFVILVGDELAGSTRYGDIRAAHAGLEIGWTWLARKWHSTGVNRRMKRLLLTHAFERMGMERVQLKTDVRNTRSQRAIEKLGALKEGVLRAHLRRPDGTLRDTVMYSVTRADWPAVQARLSQD
ncbi:GNAT family N-acetyltransferase [Deinococcus ficus]|uniref:GNAT family N-acetyltransferase n=1 Tax=Deinococcus ficus TaxID=317577 RepID=UPI00174D681D|nr:GNAT family protein [Deinococcus ficus]GHF76776.1 N-acetyltransferase [Deinococcus ficus]